jgi:hypothetical protein
MLSDPNAVLLMEESGSVSTPCTSSLASEGSSEEIRARPKSIMAVLARYHEMKLKVDLILARYHEMKLKVDLISQSVAVFSLSDCPSSSLPLFNLFGFIVTAYWLNMHKDMLESDFLNYDVFITVWLCFFT